MMNSGDMLFGGAIMWFILVLIIVGLITFIKIIPGGNSGKTGRQEETPLEILEKRFARGEIDEQEFEKRRKELKG